MFLDKRQPKPQIHQCSCYKVGGIARDTCNHTLKRFFEFHVQDFLRCNKYVHRKTFGGVITSKHTDSEMHILTPSTQQKVTHGKTGAPKAKRRKLGTFSGEIVQVSQNILQNCRKYEFVRPSPLKIGPNMS